jgi:ferrous iron transport protein A
LLLNIELDNHFQIKQYSSIYIWMEETMDWQTVLLVLIIALAFFGLVRYAFKVHKKGHTCSGGCGGCVARGGHGESRHSSESSRMTLEQLPEGKDAVVVAVQAGGEMGRRLRDMGLIPGENVRKVGHAPMRDPVALRLRNFTLSLRETEASCVIVEAAA